MKTRNILAAAALAFISLTVSAQQPTTGNGGTNLQVFYDFGGDRQIVTTTLEGFYNDPWGNTFFFVDHDYRPGASFIDGTYMEIARCLNFWHDTPLAPLSLQVEYNGGIYDAYRINHAFLGGVDWFLHSEDYRNTLNIKLLYKHIIYEDRTVRSKLPMQFTVVWGMQDLFGVQGLNFSGFGDFWGEEHTLLFNSKGEPLAESQNASFVFMASL